MPAAQVISVNRGPEADLLIGGKPGRSAIAKRPAADRVALGLLGLDGDEQADKESHGCFEQAVYAYSREDLDWWTEQISRELPNGMFGENLTMAGIDVSAALIGETWRVGTAVVQVTAPRIPCVTFKSCLDEPRWVTRFADAGRPRASLRAPAGGSLGAA